MLNIILNGCNGRMGQVLTRMIAAGENMQVVAGIDATGEVKSDYPVFKSAEDCDIKADVIIDFSHYTAVPNLLRHAAKNKNTDRRSHHRSRRRMLRNAKSGFQRNPGLPLREYVHRHQRAGESDFGDHSGTGRKIQRGDY